LGTGAEFLKPEFTVRIGEIFETHLELESKKKYGSLTYEKKESKIS